MNAHACRVFLMVAGALSAGCSGSSSSSIADNGSEAPLSGFESGEESSFYLVDSDAIEGGGIDATLPADEGCTSDSECDSGEACSCLGDCVPAGGLACVEDKNCGSEAYCDVCSGHCESLKSSCESCTEDHECAGVGSACLDLLSGERVCGTACLSAAACPPGYSCVGVVNVSVNQCVPTSGTCASVGECQVDADCPFPMICNAVVLLCADGCADDQACSEGLVCEGGHCVAGCDDASSPCPANQICEAGHCTIPGGCVGSTDCEAEETYCDLETHMCVSGCQADYDCKNSAMTCEEGACVPKACTGNWQCAFGQFCNPGTGVCEDALGPFCASCDPGNDTVCAPAGAGNLCVDFTDENNSDLGAYCLVSCALDPENGCPQGYACTPVETGENSELLCTRDCPVPPVGAAPAP